MKFQRWKSVNCQQSNTFIHCTPKVGSPREPRCIHARLMTTSFEISIRVTYVGPHSMSNNKTTCDILSICCFHAEWFCACVSVNLPVRAKPALHTRSFPLASVCLCGCNAFTKIVDILPLSHSSHTLCANVFALYATGNKAGMYVADPRGAQQRRIILF